MSLVELVEHHSLTASRKLFPTFPVLNLPILSTTEHTTKRLSNPTPIARPVDAWVYGITLGLNALIMSDVVVRGTSICKRVIRRLAVKQPATNAPIPDACTRN